MKRNPAFGIVFLLLIVLVLLEACKSTYPVKEMKTNAKQVPAEELERGEKLVGLACSPCHYDQATEKLTGTHLTDIPKILGKVYASNLTQHPDNAITKYSDGELKYLLRTGIMKNGKMSPFMQKPNLADEDIDAIIAFLRSDDDMVQPVPQSLPKTRYTGIGKIALKTLKPMPYIEKEIAAPKVTDKVAYGKYLIDIIGCYDCHSANFMKLDKMNPENTKGYMGGGSKMRSADGEKIVARNLTFHETGLAGWTEKDLSKALRQGIDNENRVIRYPMRIFSDLDDNDIEAIYLYLKSLPQINNPGANPKSKKKG